MFRLFRENAVTMPKGSTCSISSVGEDDQNEFNLVHDHDHNDHEQEVGLGVVGALAASVTEPLPGATLHSTKTAPRYNVSQV